MTSPDNQFRRRVRASMAAFVAALVVTLVAVTATGAFGAWSQNSSRSQALSFASVSLTGTDASSGTLSTTFGPATPGSSAVRYVQITNASDVSFSSVTISAAMGALANTVDVPPPPSTFGTSVTVAVAYCSGTWGGVGAPANCTGGSGWQSGLSSASDLTTLATPVSLLSAAAPTAQASSKALRITLTLAENAPANLEGVTVPVTWGFTGSAGATPASVLPSAPAAVYANAGSGKVLLSWSPANAGSSAVSDYSIEYSANGGSTWSTFAHNATTTTQLAVTGLTDATAYLFRVGGISSAGTGAKTTSSAVTPSPLHLALPGTAGNCASSPDSSVADATGDLDVAVLALPTGGWTWASAGVVYTLAAHSSAPGNQRGWHFEVLGHGRLRLVASRDGTEELTATSSVSVTGGAALWVRVTRSSSTGQVNFSTSTNGTDWTALGTTQSTTAGALYANNSWLTIGCAAAGAVEPFQGKIWRTVIRGTIDGSVAYDANASSGWVGGASFDTAVGSTTVTVLTSGATPAAIVAG
jgi:hypothetical protein